jgi:hypothetical protein
MLLAAASQAAAQDGGRRATASAVAGGGRTWDDESSLGTGTVVGGRAEWALFDHASLEGSVEALRHDRTGGFFQAEGTSAIVSVSLLHRFGRGAARPYVLEGLSLVRHSGTTRFDGLLREQRSTDGGFHVGGGLAVRLGDRFEIGPEARFYFLRTSGGSDPSLAYWIGGRFGIRF